MQQYMSTYKVTLETKGPLYIGSGKQLGKKEYIHNRQKKEIVVPNLIKMYQPVSVSYTHLDVYKRQGR